MTKKDYELIAAAIHRTAMARTIGKTLNGEQTLRLLVSDLSASLRHANPRFDPDIFKARCGVQS